MYYSFYSSPLGQITLTADNQGLTALSFQTAKQQISIDNYIQNKTIFSDVHKQLDQYFNGTRKVFDLPLSLAGTTFQKQVWQALQTIKHGETQSYAWLAKQINNPKAVRAVGAANGKNPIALIIPCHRVIGANGSLTGYAGGLTLKSKLLELEGIKFNK